MKWLTYGFLAAGILLGVSGCQSSSCSSLMETCRTSRSSGAAGEWEYSPSDTASGGAKCNKYGEYWICAASLQTPVEQWYPKCRLPVVRLCYKSGQPVKGEKFCVFTDDGTNGWEYDPYAVKYACDPAN